MDREKLKERWRRNTIIYITKHKQSGLCLNCPQPAIKWGYCQYHLLESIKRDKVKKMKRKETNKCVACGKLLEQEELGFFTCINCRQKIHPIYIHETITSPLP